MKHIYLLWGIEEPIYVDKTDKDFNEYIEADGGYNKILIQEGMLHVRRLGIIKSTIFRIQIGIATMIDLLRRD